MQSNLQFTQQSVYANHDWVSTLGVGFDEEWLEHREMPKQPHEKTILSLYDYSGNWSAPYAHAGYNVICLDIKHGQDANDFNVSYLTEYLGIPEVYGILAGLPCTDFAGSGARWWKEKDRPSDGRTKASLQLVYQTLRTIEFFHPKFWVIENPVGRLPKLVEELNCKPWYFNPCDFARDIPEEMYTKKTGLWGVFTPPTKEALAGHDRGAPPILGSKMHRTLGGNSQRTKTLRSITPMGFAQAFFECNQ